VSDPQAVAPELVTTESPAEHHPRSSSRRAVGPDLNPAQAHANELLRSPGGPRPTFPADLGTRLRAHLETDVAEAVTALEEASVDRLYIGKFALGSVHGCEARHVAQEAQPFRVGAPVVAGTVAHKAIQYSQHWDRQPVPAELVEAALAQLAAEQDRNGLWFEAASAPDRAEVRSAAADRVTKFLECFPPLRRSWRPVLESSLRAELGGGRIILSGRVDLVLGQSQGLVAGKAFVDFKTGGAWAGHADDLRFYALLEALRLGVPPFRLASYYLDQGDICSEDVNEDLLESAAARAADGIVKLVELKVGRRKPLRRAGPGCRRCPLNDSCADGHGYLVDRELSP
jgi:hypothetical protein